MKNKLQRLSDTSKRIRSANAESAGEVIGNRAVSLGSTAAIGGSIAFIVTYYFKPPEVLHSHVDALVIYGWNTLVFIIGFLWRKHFGDNGET